MDDTKALAILARENIRVSPDWVIILPPTGTPRYNELIRLQPDDFHDAVSELLWEWDFDAIKAYDSASWTGRNTRVYSPDPPLRIVRWLYWKLRDFAEPSYECADCIGMRDHGCYCAHAGAIAPGGPGPGPFRLWLRKKLV